MLGGNENTRVIRNYVVVDVYVQLDLALLDKVKFFRVVVLLIQHITSFQIERSHVWHDGEQKLCLFVFEKVNAFDDFTMRARYDLRAKR